MLRGSNSIRVVMLAALVLAVAISSTVGSQLPVVGGSTTSAVKQTRHGTVDAQRLNSAWREQLSTEQTRLREGQVQQPATPPAQQAAGGPSTLGPVPTPAPGSIGAIVQAAFAPQGQAAVNWGLCVAQHESGDNPDAVSPTGAEGLFQFIPSTFAKTPEGRAGDSIWDPTASAEAAAWMYSQGQQAQWSTNFEC